MFWIQDYIRFLWLQHITETHSTSVLLLSVKGLTPEYQISSITKGKFTIKLIASKHKKHKHELNTLAIFYNNVREL